MRRPLIRFRYRVMLRWPGCGPELLVSYPSLGMVRWIFTTGWSDAYEDKTTESGRHLRATIRKLEAQGGRLWLQDSRIGRLYSLPAVQPVV